MCVFVYVFIQTYIVYLCWHEKEEQQSKRMIIYYFIIIIIQISLLKLE